MRTRNNTAAAAVAGQNNTTIPNGQGHGHARTLSGAAPFNEMAARSPPNSSTKNTKHVPCKFFRQGACQAGPACPFLHSTDAAIDSAPCKYFTKGNCKFGAKCALAHILPDGRRVNRPNYGQGGGSHLNLGGRVNPQAFQTQDSALTNSVLSQQRLNGQDGRYGGGYQYAGQGQEELLGVPQSHLHQQHQHQQQPTLEGLGLSTGENGLVADSKYGSPVDESRLQTSPRIGALTLRDVQLPASFDSQGISHVARYGPVAASVPSQFGLDLASPPVHRAPSDALRNLRDTAFGSDLRKPTSNFGSSPPAILEDSFGNSRFLHSQRMAPRPKVLSASVPRPTMLDDWDDNFAMEEDYLPVNLHDDVLTPQEKMRRLSRTEHELSSSQRDFSGFDRIAGTSATKVGSPLGSSPSRFGALFARQRQRKEEEQQGLTSSSFNHLHIGSPLRESSLHSFSNATNNNNTSSPSLRPIGSRPASGDISPFVSSPNTRQSSMSMISQQLHNMSLHPSTTTTTASNPPRQPPSVNNLSNNSRTASSPMTFAPTRIDEEEQSDLVFSMEEEEKENNKRNSATWTDLNKQAAASSTSVSSGNTETNGF
ncbi:spindle poison sensitivity protein Scp3, putative [Talaromyces stipitatus ATCC 10500]|uniref:Spindle poison sensitivity protein Scp3, putative n=1 Tax=Talaromyces stipitatus (strain ATCC 10500 / CBS 375.48 / QM 6759 / NRRL 1006) TaxID=441959 RepID=B8MNQ1_TALSN|nr:spindle poison sensitivity protein Scp3, putative [Talaromyces stipitatus ATCC 10500]EED14140.1 spindle poison sensitivity protein Scp3, putative [Talaromyces stipitatus ATCC 10500]